ncbi:MAG TPA: ferritin-like domain-containing protein [Chloroflexota bacterium]|nr:ferritin-like domain-containing protein [Chloroflexota bacterium]HUM70729.1 ferritin-like domain-containing protein [Chloroflexota bacterium]
MNLNSLKDVYVGQLKDVYSAEKQLTEALPKMARAASDQKLREAFENHLAETENHMQAVRTILDELAENPTSTKCKAMEGLIEEGNEIVQNGGDSDARDAALIVAAQKVEHYEIATYGSLRTFADSLGYDEAAQVLQSILNQEYAADQRLDDIAMGAYSRTGLNAAAKN